MSSTPPRHIIHLTGREPFIYYVSIGRHKVRCINLPDGAEIETHEMADGNFANLPERLAAIVVQFDMDTSTARNPSITLFIKKRGHMTVQEFNHIAEMLESPWNAFVEMMEISYRNLNSGNSDGIAYLYTDDNFQYKWDPVDQLLYVWLSDRRIGLLTAESS